MWCISSVRDLRSPGYALRSETFTASNCGISLVMGNPEGGIFIFIYIIVLAIGFVALVKGADIFVDGSSALARIFKVSSLIIGLTIVALGTSAPELAVSTLASIQGSNEIALSNVIGSNTFNLIAVLGVCAIIHPLPVNDRLLKRDFPVSIAGAFLLLLFALVPALLGGNLAISSVDQNVGQLTRWMGLVLIVLFASYIFYLIKISRNKPDESNDNEQLIPAWKCILQIIIGLALVIGGGQAVVYSAKKIAFEMGMSETLIGLTVVAIGTSLPELVTSIVASRKGETDMAVGNVIGSNIFNIFFILGVASLLRPIGVNMASVYDIAILIIVSIITLIFSFTAKTINRKEGAFLLLMYVSSVIFAVLR